MNNDVLNKIKKCLALSKSANEHEAGIALKQAQALMEKHKLSMSDVELSSIQEHLVKTDMERLRVLECRLAQMVASVFECGFFIKGNRDFVFYGLEQNVMIADYAYNALLPVLKSARKSYVFNLHGNTKLKTKRAMGNAFVLGWVESVKSKCVSLHPNYELSDLISQYEKNVLRLNTIDLNHGSLRKDKEGEAKLSGFRAGQGVNLFKAMKKNEHLKLA